MNGPAERAALTPEPLVEGRGNKTVVLIHGWPDTLRIWDSTVAALKPEYRCVRFTLPGFDVERPLPPQHAPSLDEVVAAIARVIDQVSPRQPVTLLLHDWGCFFGYQFANKHKDRVERVIGVDIGDAGSRYNLKELSIKAKLYLVSYQLWLALAWKFGGELGDRMARWAARLLHAPAPQADVNAAMGYPYAVQWLRVGGGYGRLRAFTPTVPMLFIHGERKPFQFHSQNWADRVRSRPACRVIGMRTGHWVMAQKPHDFNAAVLAWLRHTDEKSIP